MLLLRERIGDPTPRFSIFDIGDNLCRAGPDIPSQIADIACCTRLSPWQCRQRWGRFVPVFYAIRGVGVVLHFRGRGRTG